MRAKWTDLAVEAAGGALRENGLSRTVVKVENEESAQKLGRPMGTYITLACEQAMTVSLETRRALAAELAQTLRGMLPPDMKTALVVGLGNRSVTPDSLGPRTAERVLVTRHMGDCLPRDVPMSSVCAAAPGVLGVTGMETAEILRGMVAHVKPDAVIAVDALAARSSKRIASTIQITDTGITPGSGVGNHQSLDRRTLGVPVIAVGVPLVVYASTIASDALCALGEGEVEEERIAACVERVVSEKLGEMIVTPRDVDALVERMAGVLADGINQALHPSLSSSEIAQLMAQ
ncbi:MAG: GPR endopeptidase [Christensenellales bacterium]